MEAVIFSSQGRGGLISDAETCFMQSFVRIPVLNKSISVQKTFLAPVLAFQLVKGNGAFHRRIYEAENPARQQRFRFEDSLSRREVFWFGRKIIQGLQRYEARQISFNESGRLADILEAPLERVEQNPVLRFRIDVNHVVPQDQNQSAFSVHDGGGAFLGRFSSNPVGFVLFSYCYQS